jgi:hypothetical protein
VSAIRFYLWYNNHTNKWRHHMFFPLPSSATFSLIRPLERARAYREEAVVVHPELGEIRPRLMVAHRYMMELARVGLTRAIPVNDHTGETLAKVREQERLDQLKEEAFQRACIEWGIPGGTKRVEDECDQCGCTTGGTLHYRPNAMAVPTPVLFVGDCCGGE